LQINAMDLVLLSFGSILSRDRYHSEDHASELQEIRRPARLMIQSTNRSTTRAHI
jgi:hypothetical protein